jgi:molybdopterin converting factor small subunit
MVKEPVVSIEFYGSQRTITGTKSIKIPITERTLAKDILEYVRAQFPALPLDHDKYIVTVNQEVASPERRLAANDTICFLPHIGGG